MHGRVLARLVVGCAAAAGVFALALDHTHEPPTTFAGPVQQTVLPGYDVQPATSLEAVRHEQVATPSPPPVDRSYDARAALESTLDRPATVDAEGGDPVPSRLGPTHVDPLPPGSDMSDPVDTESLYERAGLARSAASAFGEPQSAQAAPVPPGRPSTLGLDAHVVPSCSGPGGDGLRVQVLYVRESDTPSRYRDVLPLIHNEIATVDDVFAVSSQKTGGDLRVRWVHRNCVPVVEEVVVPDGALDSGIDRYIEALQARGYDDPNRKYLGFADARQLCGVGTYWLDDAAERNANNGYGAAYSRVDTPCWTGSTSTPAHELMHNLGGVQRSAPNATSFGHCTDEAELMCYADGSGAALRSVCAASHSQLFDCRGDDYFNTAPTGGSYLATHWNTARSGFLDPAPQPGATQEPQGDTGDPAEIDPSDPDPTVESDWSEVSESGRRRARLSAVLTDPGNEAPLAGVSVLLERRPLSRQRWGRVTSTLTTDDTGTVTAKASRRTAKWYRFVYVGSDGRVGSTSEPVFVKKAARVGVDWRGRRNTVVGRIVDLRGRALAGEQLVLQKRHPGTMWREVAVRTSNRNGVVRVRQRPGRTTYLRWVFAGSERVLADRSARIRVRR